MQLRHIKDILTILRTRGVEIQKGLSEHELIRIESIISCRIPPDLRDLLGAGLPTSEGFPNWRDLSETAVLEEVNWPLEGLLFEVQHGSLWLSEWGERPEDAGRAIDMVKPILRSAPRLIRVYLHRYLPCEPCAHGNPVISVYGSDIVYYGVDIVDYFNIEFGDENYRHSVDAPRRIRFWSRFIWEQQGDEQNDNS